MFGQNKRAAERPGVLTAIVNGLIQTRGDLTFILNNFFFFSQILKSALLSPFRMCVRSPQRNLRPGGGKVVPVSSSRIKIFYAHFSSNHLVKFIIKIILSLYNCFHGMGLDEM